MVFCDFVDKYVAKKTAHYFSIYTNSREYFAAKRAAKRQQALQKKAMLEKNNEPKTSTKMNIEKLESYKMKKSTYRENRDRERKAAMKSTNNVSSRLRERSNAPMVDDFEYTPKADEKSRAKQEKLHELLNLRRSDRITRGNRKNMNEQVQSYFSLIFSGTMSARPVEIPEKLKTCAHAQCVARYIIWSVLD